MRSIRVRVLLLVCTLALAGGVWAPGSVGATTGHYSVGAEFASFDETGCVETKVRVQATTLNGQHYMEVDALEVYDHCAGEALLWVFGNTTTFTMQVHPQFRTATLTGTVTVLECQWSGCPIPSGQLSVDLTFTGMGEITGGGRSDSYRSAIAVGTVTDGVTNYTPEPSIDGRLYRGKNSN
jgi:FlaG/FlaF family flagellin (archaellin)